MKRTLGIPLLALSAASVPLDAAAKPPVHKDPNTGGITVTSSFSIETLAQIGLDDEIKDNYCDLYQSFSNKLWVATEGQHYIAEASFFAGAGNVDILWYPTIRANADYLYRIVMGEAVATPSDDFARTLTHEFFHFFYRLPDEYLKFENGEHGFCEDMDDPELSWLGSCTSLDSSSCAMGAECVRKGGCYGGTEAGSWCVPDGTTLPVGFPVTTETDCIVGGGECISSSVCFIDNVGDPCQSETDCGTGVCMPFNGGGGEPKVCYDPMNDTCIMANSDTRSRLCNDSSHVHVDPSGRSLSNSKRILNLSAAGYFPQMSDYNCWEMAAQIHPELQIPVGYTDEVTLGSPPPLQCTWFVDDVVTQPIVNAEVLVDLSGSMITKFVAGSHKSWEAAVEGAALFRTSAWGAPDSDLGVYGFHVGFAPMPTVGGESLSIGAPVDPTDPVDPAWLADQVGDYDDPMNLPYRTNLCKALTDARTEYLASSAPQTDRNVILLTDAVHTHTAAMGGEDCDLPQLAANMCAEGIKVHVLGYGDVDVEMAEAIASEGCGQSAYIPEILAGETETHALQFAMGSMHTKLAGTLQTWSMRTPLTGGANELHMLYVPPETTRLVLDVMGDADEYVETGAGLDPIVVFNQLQFTIVSPSGILYNFDGSTAELQSRFRELVVENPESGYWQIDVDTSAVPPWMRTDHKVGWSASIRHPSAYADAWTDEPTYSYAQPVPIRAVLGIGDRLTDISASAMVRAGGQEWLVPLYDDGLHDDGVDGDGIYGGIFWPSAFGTHTVDVQLHATSGIARTVPGETTDGSPRPAPVVLGHDFDGVADFAFSVQRGIALEVGPLVEGLADGSWLDADASGSANLLATVGNAAGSEGTDEIACLAATCRVLGRGGDDVLLAAPGAELTELHGGEGDDILVGSEGRDVVLPGPGADFVSTGGGDDFVVVRHACELDAEDAFSGGEGYDVLVVPTGTELEGLRIEGFEEVVEHDGLEGWSECE